MAIKYLDAKRIRGIFKAGKVGAKNWKSTTGNSAIQLGTTALATGDFTVGMWVKRNTTQTACIYATDDAGGSNGKITIKWHNDSNYGLWLVYDGSTHIKIGSHGGETGTWRHVTVTGINNSGTLTLTLYVDGAVATPSGSGGTSNPTTSSTTTRSDNTAKTIGNENTAGDGLIGELDEFFIYNRGLSTSEVLSIANGTKKPDDSSLNTSSSLKCYLPLDADYNDASGLGNNGTESSAGNLDGNGALVAETEVDDKATLLNSSAVGSDGNWTTVTALTADTSTATPTNLDTASWDCNGASGDTTKISLTGGQIFPKDSSFTFSTWIKPSSQQTACLIDDDGGTNSVVVFVQGGGTALEFTVKKDGSTSVGTEASYTFSSGSWYNIVCTFDKDTGTTKSYVNYSTTVQTATNSSVDTCATNTAWKMIGNGSETYGGLMLESAIWDKVLTDSERSSLYDSGDGAKANTIASDNLICYWNGADVSAPITNDGINKSNLPENTLFEETDTRKIYWLQDNAWKPVYPDYETDFSTRTGWTAFADSGHSNKILIDTSTERLNWLVQNVSNKRWVEWRYCLGTDTNVESKWILRFKFHFTSGDANTPVFVLVSNDKDNGTNEWQRACGLMFQDDGGSSFRAIVPNGTGSGTDFCNTNLTTVISNSITPVDGRDYWIELLKSPTQLILNVYSDEYDTLLGTATRSAAENDIKDQRVIKIMNHRCSGSSNTMSGWIDDMKFWNGINTTGDL